MQGKNLVLIGFMGAGKSVTSQRLAVRLHRECVSTDALVEQRAEGRTIADLFKIEGEAYFRQLEKDAVKYAAGKQNVVIDCGGGVILDQDNMVQLQRNGIVIYLSVEPQTVLGRIKDKGTRPLLNGDDQLLKIKDLLSKRRFLYERANYTVITDNKTPDQVCDDILKVISYE